MNAKKCLMVICMAALLLAGCGQVDEQQAERILSGAAQTTIAGVTLVPDTPAATEDVNVIVKETFAAMTQQAGGARPASTPTAAAIQASPTASAATGSISGDLNYPAASIPAMYVVAYHYGDEVYKYVITMPGQKTYEINDLIPGSYWVIAYTVGGDGFPAGLPGGYTKAVPCGLSASCTDHTLISIPINPGSKVTGIDPFDWYAPQGTFMPFPQQGVAGGSPTLSTTPMDNIPAMGNITGTLSYPASSIPAMRIAAFDTTSMQVSYYDTPAGQANYDLGVPAGTFYVVAYTLGGGGFPSGLAGGYTQAVPCGLSVSCTNHALIPVTVTANHTTTGINLGDWYAPAGIYPPMPSP